VKTSQFSFDLPEELIAQEPAAERGTSRLLVLDSPAGSMAHVTVAALREHITPGTVMVLNDTRVRKARLFGTSAGGGVHEFLLLRRVGPGTDLWEAMCSRARRARPGALYEFAGGVSGTVEERGDAGSGGAGGTRDSATRLVRFTPGLTDEWLETHGHVPLPPYIKRGDRHADQERYQTVYSRVTGSAAAPTAGLHFTPEILEGVAAAGITVCRVTLHVGLGTFLPIRSDEIEGHTMHEEHYSVSPATSEAVNAARSEGRPVLAVGTTVVRTLESAWDHGGLRAGDGATGLYITPGYRFNVVSAMLTNFHTPLSSLLVMVSAFAGRELILDAYAEAVRLRYRFFSYGDAMLIRRPTLPLRGARVGRR
jgi:S-adenosylmethionine:tRNA ribosyltransferase-isomerase